MTVITKVRAWLDAQGFTLEMRTAAAFRAAGFEVWQSSHYLDAVTGKAREIDVLATNPDDLGAIQIKFFIECKSTKAPWALLCSRHTLEGYNRIFAFGALSDEACEVLINRLIEEKRLPKFSWMRKEGLVGYAVPQAFLKAAASTAYSAATTVAKACDGFTRAEHRMPCLRFGFPVIVIDAPLIRCSLAENGDIQLEGVDEGEFLFFLGGLVHDFGSCIRVVTAGRLSAFAREAKQAADQIRAELKSEEKKIMESWRRK